MKKPAWNRLQGLFERAREGDRGAWFRLEVDVVRLLSHSLSKERWLKIDQSEAKDLARDAFEVMALHAKDIPSWPQAWTYASKAAVALAFKHIREKKKHRRLETGLSLTDPRSERFAYGSSRRSSRRRRSSSRSGRASWHPASRFPAHPRPADRRRAFAGREPRFAGPRGPAG